MGVDGLVLLHFVFVFFFKTTLAPFSVNDTLYKHLLLNFPFSPFPSIFKE